MYTLLLELTNKINELNALIIEADKYIGKKQNGQLRISARGNQRQYYLRTDEICRKYVNGKYLKKGEKQIAIDIAQREYCEAVKKAAEKQLAELKKLHRTMLEDGVSKVYANLNNLRKELITPVYLTDEDFISNWEKTPYEGKVFENDITGYITNKGERVRSKSEKIIADFLFANNIPYKYEKPLKLKVKNGDIITIYPDFTILHVHDRKEIYHEHFGKMDDLDYAQNAVRKIETYENNGIFPGKNLIMTFETAARPLDTKLMQNVIKRALNI